MIEKLLRSVAEDSNVISFAGGLPAEETFPRAALAHAAADAMMDPKEGPLQYGWAEGRAGLRELIAQRLRARGAQVAADEVIVTNGAQEALALILAMLPPQDVQVDHTTYPGALDLLIAGGFNPVAGQLKAVRYAMPAIHNPTGWTMTEEHRAQLLESQLLIEDDAYSDLRFDGPSPEPMIARARDKVFHLGSFSKTLSPGLRVGYVVPPPQWLADLRRVKGERDLQASGVSQAIVERLLASGDFDNRLGGLRTYYRQRAETMMGAMPAMHGAHFAMPMGGFSIWVQTELPCTDDDLLRQAIAHGVAFDPGCLFRADPSKASAAAFRVSFSCVPKDRIVEGIGRLARTLEDAHAPPQRSRVAA